LDNINDARHGVHLEYGEHGFDMERTSLPHSSDVQHVQAAIDPARRRRSLDGERQIVPDCTRDVSVCPTGNIDVMSQIRPTLAMYTAVTYAQRYVQDQNLLLCSASSTISHIKWVVLLIFMRT
jgi:hypothetical protein